MRQNNIFNNLKIWLLTLVFVICMASISFADSLISFGNGTMYQYDDGTFAKSKWVWVDNNNEDMYTRHYFDGAGMMLTNASTPDGKRVNAKGQLVENGQVVSMKYIVLNSKLIEGPVRVDVKLGDKKEDVLAKLRAIGFSFNISIENYRISYLDYDGTFVNYLFNEADVCMKITRTVMCNDFASSIVFERFIEKIANEYIMLYNEEDRDGTYFTFIKNNEDGKTNYININRKDNHDGYFVVEDIETMS